MTKTLYMQYYVYCRYDILATYIVNFILSKKCTSHVSQFCTKSVYVICPTMTKTSYMQYHRYCGYDIWPTHIVNLILSKKMHADATHFCTKLVEPVIIKVCKIVIKLNYSTNKMHKTVVN